MERLADLYLLAFLIARSPKTRIAVIDGHSFGAGAPLALCHLNFVDKCLDGSKAAKKFCIATTNTVFSLQVAFFANPVYTLSPLSCMCSELLGNNPYTFSFTACFITSSRTTHLCTMVCIIVYLHSWLYSHPPSHSMARK